MVHMHSWNISVSGIVLPSAVSFPSLPVSRHNNLALLQQYGSNAWRTHNYFLEANVKNAEKLLEELKEQTTNLNRERKNSQVSMTGRHGNSVQELIWCRRVSGIS
jgi:hypothetical protein